MAARDRHIEKKQYRRRERESEIVKIWTGKKIYPLFFEATE